MLLELADGRILTGTPLEIVTQMRAASQNRAGTIPEYVAWIVRNVREAWGDELKVVGATDEELAGALVAEFVRLGLAERRG